MRERPLRFIARVVTFTTLIGVALHAWYVGDIEYAQAVTVVTVVLALTGVWAMYEEAKG